MLYNVLHIGDKVLNIAGISVKSAADAYRILESHYCGLYVDIVIKRIPHGQVFLIHRETEGQSLGIVQENNTAVIESVEGDSPAARQGLSAKTKTCDGLSLTNWVLTEINGRPLNLFFKKNQVRDRLNSVGRDISILVQPLDLIKQLKKELKSLRNYKEYILQ
jgi:S1-C subfamily serine protease